MAHQLEARMLQEVIDILFGAGEKIVDAEDCVTIFEQALAKMRSKEAGASCDENGLSFHHFVPRHSGSQLNI
jgi:hypothetical protein